MPIPSHMIPFIASASFVLLNEMGDKTQLLAMAFATRIKFWKVMLGVLFATLLNHGLAVAVGTLLASVPGWQGWVRFSASALFIVFGLWALKSDQLGRESTKKKNGCGDIATVGFAFFFAEMGDKTQLATITLSARYSSAPLVVLAGTTTGMLIADGIGVLVGVVLNKKLPDRLMKILASVLFVVFGLVGLWESLRETFFLRIPLSATIVSAVAVISLLIGIWVYRKDSRNVH